LTTSVIEGHPVLSRTKWAEYIRCLDITLKFEGVPGKVDDPDDPGGRTAYGVTQRVYNSWRRSMDTEPRDVWTITMPEVQAIYHRDYWLRSGAPFQPWPMSLLVFDAAVNHGVSRALRFRTESGGDPIKYLDIRVAFYHAIVRGRPTSRKYLRGWLNRADTLRHICFPQVPSLERVAELARAA
jgi:hypothetical protein